MITPKSKFQQAKDQADVIVDREIDYYLIYSSVVLTVSNPNLFMLYFGLSYLAARVAKDFLKDGCYALIDGGTPLEDQLRRHKYGDTRTVSEIRDKLVKGTMITTLGSQSAATMALVYFWK